MESFRANSLSKQYPGSRCGISNISFNLYTGEIVGLLGANGAGKTTTIKACAGFLDDYEGTTSISKNSENGQGGDKSAIAYIPDAPILFEFMTVQEYLNMVYSAFHEQGLYTVDEVMQQFQLDSQANKFPSHLSKGTKQKLSISLGLVASIYVFVR